MHLDPTLIRSISLFLPITAVWLLFMWRQPNHRQIAGAWLACAWTIPSLLVLHLLAIQLGWWWFEAEGGLFMDMAVDLFLGWVLLWGPIPALAFPRTNLLIVLASMLLFDLVAMPQLSPVVQLGPNWLLGETAGILFSLLPAQLLARWVSNDSHLLARVRLLVIAFGSLTFWRSTRTHFRTDRRKLESAV